MQENNELSIRNTSLNEKGVQIKTFEQLLEFGELVVKSGLAPKNFTSKEAVVIAVQFGLEIGLSPMQSLQSVAVINGIPSIYGDAAKALVLSDPSCEWVKEYNEGTIKDGTYTAFCVSKRKGADSPLTTSFSIEDAKIAGLWGSNNIWKKYPKRMLMFRARGFNLRDNFTDIMKGFKTVEEVSDYKEADTIKPSNKKAYKTQSLKSDLPPSAAEDVEYIEIK